MEQVKRVVDGDNQGSKAEKPKAIPSAAELKLFTTEFGLHINLVNKVY